jgi:peptide/nickel transport system substrate-binding protein
MKYCLLLFSLILNLYSSSLHLAISSNPSRLNPLLATDSASGEIAGWIFDSLIKYDKNGQIIPHLAQNYYFKDDTTLIFKLKKNIKWSDGKDFTANDVVFTYKLITSPQIYTPYKDEFRYVKSVTKIDPYTVEITYKRPYFKALHTWMSSIVPEHILKDQQDIMTNKFNQYPIGTGPYTIKDLKISQDITMKSNKNYFIKTPNIDKIVYHFIPDPSTQFFMLKTKKLDVGSLTPLQLQRQLNHEFRSHYNIHKRASNSYTYLGFNLTSDKFKDPRVRRAIDLSIDKQELVDILFFGHGVVCNGPFMPNTFAYNKDIKPLKLNTKLAKELLKEAGYTKEHPLEFTITTNSNNPTRVYATQIIQHQLKKVDIKVTIRAMEWQAFLNTVVMPRKFEAVVLGWGLSLMPDAYSIWHSNSIKKGGFNFVGYQNSRVDRLITTAEGLIDQQIVSKHYQEIFKLIRDDNPYIFLYIPDSIVAVNKNIQNVSNSVLGVMHNVIDWIKP